MDWEALKTLPSPFYRVAVKALIFDEQTRLLVACNDKGSYEIPGGGWEHDESLESCVRRELMEEIGAHVRRIGPIELVFQGKSKHGWQVLRLGVRAELENHEFKPGDGIVEARFVSPEEFMQLDFDPADRNFQNHADQIWLQG